MVTNLLSKNITEIHFSKSYEMDHMKDILFILNVFIGVFHNLAKEKV